MNLKKQYLLTIIVTSAILAAVFGISKYYAEKMAVPVITYAEAEITSESAVVCAYVDLNSATAEELESIEGIGAATAEKIVNYRKKYGDFNSVEELLEVDGIGEARFESVRDIFFVSDHTPDTSEPDTAYEASEVKIEEVQSDSTYADYTPDFPLDLNNTSIEDLVYIKGIGKATAEKIIAYADEYGFNSVEELINVNGIGEKKLEAIRPYVIVDRTEASTVKSSLPLQEEAYIININTASKEELMKLNGVGEVIAERIREYAEKTGFETVDDLINIKGIGEKKLELIRPYVTV